MITCPCGAEVQSAYLCRVCVGRLRRDLRRIADLWPETEVVLTRQTVGPRGSKGKTTRGAKSTPLPYDETASETRWVVENTVTTWVRDIAGDTVPNGVSDVPSAARWLAEHAQQVAGQPQAPDAFAELEDAARSITRLVDRRTDRVTAECGTCGKTLAAEPEDLTTICSACEVVVDIPAARAEKVMRAHRERITRAKAVAAAAQVYRVALTDRTFDRWAKRGDLRPDENGLYSVEELLVQVEKIVAKRRIIA